MSFSLQWVVSLEIDVCSESLVVACQDSVYCLDTQVDTHGLLMVDQGYTNHRGYSNLPVNIVGSFLIASSNNCELQVFFSAQLLHLLSALLVYTCMRKPYVNTIIKNAKMLVFCYAIEKSYR